MHVEVMDFIPSVSGWGCATIIQVQNKFRPLGAAVGEVDGGIIVKGQLDCSRWENEDVGEVVGSMVVHTLHTARRT